MRNLLIPILLTLLGGGTACAQLTELDDKRVLALREVILLTADERAFERIPWRTVLWDAVLKRTNPTAPC